MKQAGAAFSYLTYCHCGSTLLCALALTQASGPCERGAQEKFLFKNDKRENEMATVCLEKKRSRAEHGLNREAEKGESRGGTGDRRGKQRERQELKVGAPIYVHNRSWGKKEGVRPHRLQYILTNRIFQIASNLKNGRAGWFSAVLVCDVVAPEAA